METAEELARRIASGHAVNKHLQEFEDLGIKTAEQFRQYIKTILRDKEIECFSAFETCQQWRKADIYYHESTNILIVDPGNNNNESTAHRPLTGRKAFNSKHEEAERIEKRSIKIVRGMENLQEQKGQITFAQEQNLARQERQTNEGERTPTNAPAIVNKRRPRAQTAEEMRERMKQHRGQRRTRTPDKGGDG